MMDRFGVFILKGGHWQQWATGAEGFVRSEARYLRDSLGLTARVFERVPA